MKPHRIDRNSFTTPLLLFVIWLTSGINYFAWEHNENIIAIISVIIAIAAGNLLIYLERKPKDVDVFGAPAANSASPKKFNNEKSSEKNLMDIKNVKEIQKLTEDAVNHREESQKEILLSFFEQINTQIEESAKNGLNKRRFGFSNFKEWFSNDKDVSREAFYKSIPLIAEEYRARGYKVSIIRDGLFSDITISWEKRGRSNDRTNKKWRQKIMDKRLLKEAFYLDGAVIGIAINL